MGGVKNDCKASDVVELKRTVVSEIVVLGRRAVLWCWPEGDGMIISVLDIACWSLPVQDLELDEYIWVAFTQVNEAVRMNDMKMEEG